MIVLGRKQTAEGRARDGSQGARWSGRRDQPPSAEWSSPPQTSDEVLRQSRPQAASGSIAETEREISTNKERGEKRLKNVGRITEVMNSDTNR